MAEVILPDGRNLNQEVVRAGLARWYRQFANAARQDALVEKEARAAKRGLWADPNPMAPGEWRKQGAAVYSKE